MLQIVRFSFFHWQDIYFCNLISQFLALNHKHNNNFFFANFEVFSEYDELIQTFHRVLYNFLTLYHDYSLLYI